MQLSTLLMFLKILLVDENRWLLQVLLFLGLITILNIKKRTSTNIYSKAHQYFFIVFFLSFFFFSHRHCFSPSSLLYFVPFPFFFPLLFSVSFRIVLYSLSDISFSFSSPIRLTIIISVHFCWWNQFLILKKDQINKILSNTARLLF